MEEENEEIMEKVINLIDSVNNLMRAVMNKDRKDIKHWQKSIKTWQGYLDKKISRYLKEIKEEKIPF